MYHKLSQLLQDKSRRAKLAKNKFRFVDTSGDFAVLDFENKSIRINHRAAFDQISRLGGEKLLEKLLAEGNTCLTDNPDAAKNGVYPIAGTERFFLKTNAGDPTALTSILFGIAGWGEVCEGWDEDDIIIEDYSEDDALMESCMREVVESEEEHRYMLGDDELDELEFDFFAAPEARFCDIVTRNGKPSIFDRNTRAFLPVFDADGKAVEEMFNLEEVCVFDDEILGYRFQLEKDGKWGFISRGFTQFLAPNFDEIIAAQGRFSPMIFAWTLDKEPFGTEAEPVLTVHYSGSVALRGADFSDYWLPTPFSQHGGIIGGLDRYCKPTPFAYVDEETTDKGEHIRLYNPGMKGAPSFLTRTNDEEVHSENWYATYSTGFLTLNALQGSDISGPAAEISLSACIRLLEADASAVKATGCLKLIEGDWTFAETGLYTVCKDALYAVAELELKTGSVIRLLTPFAFTSAYILSENFVLVDLFGKKGIFCCSSQEYIVPCDYETVRMVEDERLNIHFAVTRVGFSGEIDEYGNWSEALHR